MLVSQYYLLQYKPKYEDIVISFEFRIRQKLKRYFDFKFNGRAFCNFFLLQRVLILYTSIPTILHIDNFLIRDLIVFRVQPRKKPNS